MQTQYYMVALLLTGMLFILINILSRPQENKIRNIIKSIEKLENRKNNKNNRKS